MINSASRWIGSRRYLRRSQWLSACLVSMSARLPPVLSPYRARCLAAWHCLQRRYCLPCLSVIHAVLPAEYACPCLQACLRRLSSAGTGTAASDAYRGLGVRVRRSLPCPSACLARYRRCAAALHGRQVRCVPREYQSAYPHLGHTGLVPELIMTFVPIVVSKYRGKLGQLILAGAS